MSGLRMERQYRLIRGVRTIRAAKNEATARWKAMRAKAAFRKSVRNAKSSSTRPSAAPARGGQAQEAHRDAPRPRPPEAGKVRTSRTPERRKTADASFGFPVQEIESVPLRIGEIAVRLRGRP